MIVIYSLATLAPRGSWLTLVSIKTTTWKQIDIVGGHLQYTESNVMKKVTKCMFEREVESQVIKDVSIQSVDFGEDIR